MTSSKHNSFSDFIRGTPGNKVMGKTLSDPLNLLAPSAGERAEADAIAPVPPAATAAPNTDDAGQFADNYTEQLKKRNGRQSTILSGQSGYAVSNKNLATNLLLGA